jgi:prepilin-type processing-associated H-X9-DG protein
MDETRRTVGRKKLKLYATALMPLVFGGAAIWTFDTHRAGGFSLIGLLVGLVALVTVREKGGKLVECTVAILGIILNALILSTFFVAFFGGGLYFSKVPMPSRVVCRKNLKAVGKALRAYANDTGLTAYPQADKWCDLLIHYYEADNVSPMGREQFLCRGALEKDEQGPCHYAINPNCKPRSPDDTVLLFETKGGWNQFGGPDTLTTENHNGKGCNVLFNDGSVRFVKTGKLDKLKW